MPACASRRATQQDVMQREVPFKATLESHCIVCLLRRLDLSKRLRMCRRPVLLVSQRYIPEVATWRHHTLDERCDVDRRPLRRIRLTRRGYRGRSSRPIRPGLVIAPATSVRSQAEAPSPLT